PLAAARTLSAGPLLAAPPLRSATSQGPAAGRHSAVLFASAGQATLVPVQASATSHAPAAGRHTVPAWPAGCWHASLLPSHWSSVHGLPSSLQAVPLACFASAGHAALEIGRASGRASAHAATRHAVLAG